MDVVELSLMEDAKGLIERFIVDDVQHYCCCVLVNWINVVLEVDYIGVKEGWKFDFSIIVDVYEIFVKIWLVYRNITLKFWEKSSFDESEWL